MLYQYLYEFSVVAQEHSLSRAAIKLNLSQAALGRHLTSLEQQLSATLLERDSRGVRLTQDGRFILDTALDIASLGESVVRHFSSETRRRRERRIVVGGLSDSKLADSVFNRACLTLNEEGYQLSVRFIPARSYDPLDEKLQDGEADIILAYRSAVQKSALRDDLAIRKLFAVQPVAVVDTDHPIAGFETVSIDEVKGLTFGRTSGERDNMGAMWDEFCMLCEEHDFTPRSRTLWVEGYPGYSVHHHDRAFIYSSDNYYMGPMRDSDHIVVPLTGAAFEVFAVSRARDEVIQRFLNEVQQILASQQSD